MVSVRAVRGLPSLSGSTHFIIGAVTYVGTCLPTPPNSRLTICMCHLLRDAIGGWLLGPRLQKQISRRGILKKPPLNDSPSGEVVPIVFCPLDRAACLRECFGIGCVFGDRVKVSGGSEDADAVLRAMLVCPPCVHDDNSPSGDDCGNGEAFGGDVCRLLIGQGLVSHGLVSQFCPT